MAELEKVHGQSVTWGDFASYRCRPSLPPQASRRLCKKYQRESCSYKELYYLLTDLYGLVPVKFPELPVPTYGSKVSSPDVPSDDYIVDFITKSEPKYAWSLGMITTYGL